jgi:hypothetical protein
MNMPHLLRIRAGEKRLGACDAQLTKEFGLRIET